MKERVVSQGCFKEIKIKEEISHADKIQEGTENAICVVAVSSVGEISIITFINYSEVKEYLLEDCIMFMESDFEKVPGIYLVEFDIEGEKYYWGEYDSWLVFDNIIKYKISIEDKRKHADDMYDNPGSEYPRCLFIINSSGAGVIIDVLNEYKAYKSITKEMVYHMEELDEVDDRIKLLGLYEATFSIDGDMENLLDRDIDESIKLSDIQMVDLILEDQERVEKKETIFYKYVNKLRTQKQHIL